MNYTENQSVVYVSFVSGEKADSKQVLINKHMPSMTLNPIQPPGAPPQQPEYKEVPVT